MNKNITALVKACQNQNIKYHFHHLSKNLLTVDILGNQYLFANWTTPLNSSSIVHLCKDKDYFYSFYKDTVKMPKTYAYLNPYIDERYASYLSEKSIYDIIESTEKQFNYPLIVKKNRGSMGAMVFKVDERSQLEQAIIAVFNNNNSSYDYVCLCQEYINIVKEYRVIYLNGQYQFSYVKLCDEDLISKNLSPLHRKNSSAQLITNKDIINQLNGFCSEIFKKQLIPFCGLDIAEDSLGQLWLIEANSSPGFEHIIKHEGDEVIIKLYEKLISQLV